VTNLHKDALRQEDRETGKQRGNKKKTIAILL